MQRHDWIKGVARDGHQEKLKSLSVRGWSAMDFHCAAVSVVSVDRSCHLHIWLLILGLEFVSEGAITS